MAAPVFDTIQEEQKFQAALGKESSKPAAQKLLIDDINKITGVVKSIRESFKGLSYYFILFFAC